MKSELEQAFSKGIQFLIHEQVYRLETERQQIPKDAVKTDLHVGDHFFLEGEVEDGMALEGVVFQKTNDGYARYVLLDGHARGYTYIPYWLSAEPWLSLEEALRKTAESEINYHSKRVEYAEECLKTVEAGEDVSEFLKGRDFDR